MCVHVAVLALMSKHLNSCNQLHQETKVGPALELGAIWAGASGILGLWIPYSLEKGLDKGKLEWDPSKTGGPEQGALLPELSSNVI